jgi:hypothetical protein
VAYTRDPLSFEYDDFVLSVLEAVAQRRTWPRQGVPISAWVDVPMLDLLDNVNNSTMTRHERAFVRSLYYNARFLRPRRSFRLPVWGQRNARGRRLCQFQAFADGLAYVEANPVISYIENADMQTQGR